MKQFLEKFVALLVIISLLCSIGLDLFALKPKKAQAAAIAGDFIMQIKELVLDNVASVISNVILKRMEQNIYDWGTGRTNKLRMPFGIEDFEDYLDEFINRATGDVIQELGLTNLCTPIAISFGQRFKATLTTYYTDRPRYRQYAGCSLDKVINNVEAFLKRPRVTIYGLDAWKALTQRNNNVFGAFFSALDLKIQRINSRTNNATQQATVSGGYRNQETTTTNSIDVCKQNCQTGTGISACQGESGPVAIEASGHSAACTAAINTCVLNCERRTPDVPLKTKVMTLGSDIATSMKSALGADIGRLIDVKEITQLVGIFFSALMNKAINGLGLAFRSITATNTQKNRNTNKDRYGYLRQVSKSTTSINKKETRASILASMDASIRQFNRSIVSCDGDSMMPYQDWQKNFVDILESNVEGLYVGLTGTGIQPDAVVLDPPYAPYSVYGYSWGEVFPKKVPEKCRIMLTQLNMAGNTTCSDVVSGLEPNYGLTRIGTPQCSDGIDNDNDGFIDYPADLNCYSALDNSEAPTGGGGGGGPDPCFMDPDLPQCRQAPYVMDIIPGIGNSPCIPCMYDHDALNCPVGPVPPQRYPITLLGTTIISDVWTSAILDQKQALYDGCMGGYASALTRCDECMKAYDEKCANLYDATEKNNCIMQHCGYRGTTDPTDAFKDIIPLVIDPPTDGLDFYAKCLVEEQKDACFTCLKEYFIPATYCEQAKDYAARLVIKYPAITVNKYAKDEGEFRGLYDQGIAAMGGLCNDNDGAEAISIALICRALPEFSFRGEKVCKTRCDHGTPRITDAQLNDVADFRPDETDCNREKLPAHTGNAGGGTSDGVGGKMPFGDIEAGELSARGMCCADIWQRSTRNYQTCVGAGPTTEETGGTPGTTLSVTLSAAPFSGPAPLNNVDLTARASGASTGQDLTYNFDCNDDGVFERSETTTETTVTAADICNYPLNNTTYTASVTLITDVGVTATATATIQTTDCEINYTLDPPSGIVPVNINITAGLNNSDAGPFTYVFYCDVPTTGADITSRSNWQGASIEYVVNDNPFTLNAADNAACANITEGRARGIGVWIRSSASDTSCYTVTNRFLTPELSCTLSSSTSTSPEPGGITETMLLTTASPNQAFIDNIGTASGITFSYDCNGDGIYGDTVHTWNSYTDTGEECSSYFTDPSIETYNVSVRVSATAPSGLSGEGECGTTVTIPRAPIVQ